MRTNSGIVTRTKLRPSAQGTRAACAMAALTPSKTRIPSSPTPPIAKAMGTPARSRRSRRRTAPMPTTVSVTAPRRPARPPLDNIGPGPLPPEPDLLFPVRIPYEPSHQHQGAEPHVGHERPDGQQEVLSGLGGGPHIRCEPKCLDPHQGEEEDACCARGDIRDATSPSPETIVEDLHSDVVPPVPPVREGREDRNQQEQPIDVPAPREGGVEHVPENHVQGDQRHESRERRVDCHAEERFGDPVGPGVHPR